MYQRFARADKRSKLPRWINQYITEAASNLSTDMALVMSKLFMRTISQNPNENQTGISLWTLEDVKAHQEKMKAAAAVATVQPSGSGGHIEDAMDLDDDDEEYGDGGITDTMMAGVPDVLNAAPTAIDVF